MKASELLSDRKDFDNLSVWAKTPIGKAKAKAAVKAIDELLIQAGMTPPGCEPTDHALPRNNQVQP